MILDFVRVIRIWLNSLSNIPYIAIIIRRGVRRRTGTNTKCLSTYYLELKPADNTADVISKIDTLTAENSFIKPGLDFEVVELTTCMIFNILFRFTSYYTLINFVN